jgi:hypothetical protein
VRRVGVAVTQVRVRPAWLRRALRRAITCKKGRWGARALPGNLRELTRVHRQAAEILQHATRSCHACIMHYLGSLPQGAWQRDEGVPHRDGLGNFCDVEGGPQCVAAGALDVRHTRLACAAQFACAWRHSVPAGPHVACMCI